MVLLVFCNGLGFAVGATDSAKSTPVIRYDASKIEVRKLSAGDQQALLDNPDYKYDRVGPAPKTWWERFKEWLGRTIGKAFESDGGKVGLTIFPYIIVFAIIIIVILLLLKNDVRAVFYGKSASVAIDFKEFDEDIHNLNFEQLISDAIVKKDYRKAIRLHFLKLLKELTDKNLITWQIDKTNNDYSIELSKSQFSSKFKELSLMYEYIWYGDFPLDESNFKTSIAKFKEFKINV